MIGIVAASIGTYVATLIYGGVVWGRHRDEVVAVLPDLVRRALLVTAMGFALALGSWLAGRSAGIVLALTLGLSAAALLLVLLRDVPVRRAALAFAGAMGAGVALLIAGSAP